MIELKHFITKIILFFKHAFGLFNIPCQNIKNVSGLKDKSLSSKLLIQEIMYANYFHDSIKDSAWLKKQNFTATKGAANYSLLFTLFSILDNTNIDNILEMGLGQSTKITTQYVNNKNNFAKLTIVEHDKKWIDVFSHKLDLCNNIKFLNPQLVNIDLHGVKVTKYKNLTNELGIEKYDMIIIDGPIGGHQKYPRTNVLELIPQNLAKDFVIVLDDYDRQGEQNTAQLLFEALDKSLTNYKISTQFGSKKQLIITSTGYEFLHWL